MIAPHFHAPTASGAAHTIAPREGDYNGTSPLQGAMKMVYKEPDAAFERKWDPGPTFFSAATLTMANLPEDLLARLGRLAKSEGVELVAVEVGGTARKRVVRLVLDRDPGGVTLADCEAVSRQASVLLDAYDPFPGAFTLEASSPGLDRKLYNDKDFVRFEGCTVRVRMRPGCPPARLIEGTLQGRSDGFVRVGDRAGVTHELPKGDVLDVRLAPSLEEKGSPQHRGRM
jgi:ribosome maturation factor RimP